MTRPIRYASPLPAYVDGIFYPPGEPFETTETPGRHWVASDRAADAAECVHEPTQKSDRFPNPNQP